MSNREISGPLDDLMRGESMGIHDAIWKWARETPDATAITDERRHFTYRALAAQADALASRLIHAGVGPGVLVGLSAQRSAELVIGIVAILRSGGAYVPIDPSYPAGRCAFVLTDAQCPVLVTEKRLSATFANYAGLILLLDDAANASTSASAALSPAVTSRDAPAYVIYTSGSTGQPKGVIVTHKNVVRLFRETERWFHFDASDVWTLFHSVSFDFSVWEMWGAFYYGGRLVIVSHAVSRDAIAFRQLVRDEGVTVLNQTPSAFRYFMHADALEKVPQSDALRYVIFGGEKLNFSSLQPFFARHRNSSLQLVNMYGITETTVHVTYRLLTARDADERRSLIGTPIADLTLHLLDADGRPVATGEAGELWVGGAGVARGYLNRPELTAARFVGDDSSSDPDARLYRSGDLARFGADGELEYLGRVDQQVKLRGFRIELAEIEQVLRQAPGVAEAVVIMRTAVDGEPVLVSYVVQRPDDSFTLDQVERFLAATLPDYMRPAAIISISAVPLTVNGKLDREALPAWPSGDLAEASAPEAGIAGEIAALYCEILGRNLWGAGALSCSGDFFSLGGTSLQAMQLAIRLAQRFGVTLPAGTIFRHPTVRDLAALVERASSERGGYIAQAGMGAAPRGDDPVEAERGSSEQWHPLSIAQEQIWFVQMLHPEVRGFHCPVAFQIRGALDKAHLSRAIARAAMRHPALRTVFGLDRGRPAQRVCAEPTFQLQVRDIRGEPEIPALQTAAALALLGQPLDLERAAGGALLLQTAEDEHLFIVVLHHLVTDGWSLASLLEELKADYEGRAVATPRQSFLRLAAEQRRGLEAGERRASEAFWQSELADVPATTELIQDGARSPHGRPRSARAAFSISTALGARLVRFARTEGATPNTLLLSTLFALIQRYSGQRDLVLGVPYAGRDVPGSEAVQGVFINLLALRAVLPQGVTFRNLVREVQNRSHAAYEHSDWPFSRLVEALALKREAGRPPLAQIVFAPQPSPRDAFTLAGLTVSPLTLDPDRSPYDLVVGTWPTGEGFEVEVVYATERFSDATMHRFCDHFVRLLTSAIDSPDCAIAELEMISAKERSLLLDVWSGKVEADLARQKPGSYLPDIFAREAAAHPHAIAIRYGTDIVTYKELDELSNRIAQALCARGVGKQTIVALLCERSPTAIAGILGIWKAGAAYVPLDPGYPEARLVWMLKDSGAQLLLSSSRVLADATVPRLDLDVPEVLRAYLPQPTGVPLEPGDLAYVIYTSGSTGQPKGVMVEHLSLATLTSALVHTYTLLPQARLLQYCSLSFDVSIAEIAITFAQRGTLVIPRQRHPLAGLELLDLLEEEQIAQVLLPTSVLAQLPSRPLPHLRLLVAGGERCPAELVDRWSVGRIFRNAYGPTEASVGACVHDCVIGEGDPPIGRPLLGSQLYVLDAAGRLVPPLVPGELYIGGRGLARGYLGRPELTRERFINGVAEVPERLYRTGDRVHWRLDGTLEFLGRLDDQYKVRGFRIELGEVEATLRAHPGIQAAVAVVYGQGLAARIVAYVVPGPESRPSTESIITELRTQLRERLPSQMIPSQFMVLSSLPTTPNGKLDRAALPTPYAQITTYSSPTSEAEAVVADIWREVLGHRVARTANFFDVGGSSLRLVEVQSRLAEKQGTRWPLSELFGHPTIAAMADLVSHGKGTLGTAQRQAEARATLARQRAIARRKSS